ncbi:MAG: DUF6695 family protein [Flavobacteriaceae bacterium]|nr:DUF6695 family protein [Flavobacteriaceae bacterium]
MFKKNPKTGTAMLLAWPETLCKETTVWYDYLMRWLGINKNGYYKVGHAAIVLIEDGAEEAHYFDFGRYHAPVGYGRVRSAVTDHELKLNTKAKFAMGKLTNQIAILEEIKHNEACHGVGVLYAAEARINFKKAYQKALAMQEDSPIIYGPLVWNGTNCSRFVRTVALKAQPKGLWARIRLFLPYSVSPSPMANILAFRTFYKIKATEQQQAEHGSIPVVEYS